MAASRRGQPELHVQLPSASPGPGLNALPDLPPISALFLIDFDVKAGYTVTWKASQPGVELEGVVEYKSLPSGLHTVKEDLIYFVHDGYAGISAFVNVPCEDTEARNARMLAVGILVPLSYGRLGRAWRHAEGLKSMALKLADDPKATDILEEYWSKNRVKGEKEASDETEDTGASQQTPKSSRGPTRNRSASDGNALIPLGHKLSPLHPAWGLTKLLDTFGPLIFPIQRAALLRKRILISCQAPVHQVCDFVYDISVLSNIPSSVSCYLHSGTPSHRLRPLFTVGVHDIPFLTEDAKAPKPDEYTDEDGPQSDLGTGWVACTTDSILAMKDSLWDVLITMPPAHAVNASTRVWPTVESPRGTVLKATQRDLRRYRNLRTALARLQALSTAVESPSTPATSHTVATLQGTPTEPWLAETESIVDPLSWTALAFTGFMWWASAGEQRRTDEAEEMAHDNSLLADLTSPTMGRPGSSSAGAAQRRSSSFDMNMSLGSLTSRRASAVAAAGLDPDEARVELAIIAYFHRLTSQILSTAAELVEDHSDCEDADSNGGGDNDDDSQALPDDDPIITCRGIRVGEASMANMGLDVWSHSDEAFVKEIITKYFGRRSYVEGKAVEVCGLRVC